MDNLSGGTTNLLRMARSESRAAAAFVALALDDDMFATATYRAVPDDELFRNEAIDDLIRQAWADPEFGQGRALVRVARLGGRRLTTGKRLALAILPLVDGPGGRPWGLLGVAGPESGSFDAGQIELLRQIAHRLSSYFRARQAVRQQMTGTAAPAAGAPVTPPPAAAPPPPTVAPTAPPPAPAAAPPQPGEPSWTVSPPAGPPATPGAAGASTAPTRPQPPPAEPTRDDWTAVLEPTSAGEPGAPEFQWDQEPDEEIRWGRPTLEGEPGQEEQGRPGEPQGWDREPGTGSEPSWGTAPASGPGGADEELAWEIGAGWDTDQAPPPPTAQEAPAQPRWGAPPPVQPEPAAPPQAPGGSDPLGELLKGEDAVTGLLPLGALLGRTGRMLGAAIPGGGALAMVVLELGPGVDDETLRAAANALRGELRFDDPVARIGPRAFAAVIPLIQGSSDVPGLESHLAESVRRVLPVAGVEVRSAHTLASLDERQDAHDLLRAAVTKLRVE